MAIIQGDYFEDNIKALYKAVAELQAGSGDESAVATKVEAAGAVDKIADPASTDAEAVATALNALIDALAGN